MFDRPRWSWIFARINVAVLSFAVAFYAFDARLFMIRLGMSVPPDALVLYYWILNWWRNGDSPAGFTLCPSPYFVDILIQFPLTLLAPDYETFSYMLALTYAALLFASLFLVVRIVLGTRATFALLVTGAVIGRFYASAPFNFVVHAFIVNHTSEVFTSLGLLALLYAWFRPDAPRRRYAPYLYAFIVAGCVASSPFFIATYCIPAALATTAVLGTPYLGLRRWLWFGGLTAVGAIIGLFSIALISRYAWPVRGDAYMRWWKSYLAFKTAIASEPGGVSAALATSVACIASIVLVVIGRKRAWALPLLFALAFFPAAVVACVALPIKRGAFDNAYAFRYIQLPWLLTVTFYMCATAQLARVVWRRFAEHTRRPWLPWTSAVLGAFAIVLVTRCHGSLTMDDPRSMPAPLIRCVREADQRGDLKDGISMWWLGRYLRAAQHSWGSDHVIVHIRDDGRIDPWDNNLLWFADGFRGGRSEVNFLVTYGLGDDTLGMFRDRIGPPDRTVVCAVPDGQRLHGKQTFEVWIWDREKGRHDLTRMLLADNLRSPFSPAVGATRMAIDPMWGMDSAPDVSQLREGHRIWQRVGDGSSGAAVSIRAMWVPSGHYRLEIEVSTTERSVDPGPSFDVRITQSRKGQIARIPIAPGRRTQAVSVEFEVVNRGGATSGDPIAIDLIPGSAQSIDVTGATLVLVDQAPISPFQIFH